MVLSSLTSYVLKKGGKAPSKTTAYGMLVGLFVLNISYVSLRATLESKKGEEERIAEARERLMMSAGKGGFNFRERGRREDGEGHGTNEEENKNLHQHRKKINNHDFAKGKEQNER